MDAHRTVLVVDDEPLLRQVIGEMLRLEGYEVVEAVDAYQALALADQRLGISILSTDINMPAMSGLELAEKMADRHPDISLIVMSGRQYLDDSDLPDAGHFLPKPFTAQQLVDAIDTASAQCNGVLVSRHPYRVSL